MTTRTIVTVHLPLEMGSVGRILQTIGAFYPDAVVAAQEDGSMAILADPDRVQPYREDGECEHEIPAAECRIVGCRG